MQIVSLAQKYPFSLPPLPFSKPDLEPHYSAKTFDFHYDKHHNAYVVKLNELVKGNEFEGKTLLDIIKNSSGAIFNNAAQVYNHEFFWNSMKKNGGGQPTGAIKTLIDSSFGSYDEFLKQFKEAGVTQFGSGWAWLVQDTTTKKLSIIKTPNAETPLTKPNLNPIITADVWEHSYYIDYQNRRPDYLDIFLKHLINWDFANKNLVA
jgi:Fe-Mn family superoxide dismutase